MPKRVLAAGSGPGEGQGEATKIKNYFAKVALSVYAPGEAEALLSSCGLDHEDFMADRCEISIDQCQAIFAYLEEKHGADFVLQHPRVWALPNIRLMQGLWRARINLREALESSVELFASANAVFSLAFEVEGDVARLSLTPRQETQDSYLFGTEIITLIGLKTLLEWFVPPMEAAGMKFAMARARPPSPPALLGNLHGVLGGEPEWNAPFTAVSFPTYWLEAGPLVQGSNLFGSGAAEGEGRGPVRTQFLSGLTLRQNEVLAELLKGRTNAEIAESLNIALPTVKIHVGRILKQAGATSRAQLMARLVDFRTGGARPR